MDEDELMDPTVQSILDNKSLKWIFVGGKGGVGKTTNSSALAVNLAAVRRSVLVISTDPAHNLSDAFDQRFTKSPTPVNGFENLFAMEVDPTVEKPEGDLVEDTRAGGFLQELSSSIPGIDEAMSFGELLRQVQSMDYECVVFDTAPTGHTLRLLSFPTVLDKALSKLMQMRAQLGGIFAAVQGMMGGGASSEEEVFSRLEGMKKLIEDVNQQFQDPEKTTFVCVCIAEFLSLYETERLVQELTKQGIDSSVILVNQLVFPPSKKRCQELASEHGIEEEKIRVIYDKLCSSRARMQSKYVEQIEEL